MYAAIDRATDAFAAAGQGHGSWADAAEAACAFVGADHACCIAWSNDSRDVLLMEARGNWDAKFADYNAHYVQHDVLLECGMSLPAGTWLDSEERFPFRQWSGHPFFGGFLHDHGVRQVMALILRSSHGVTASITFHRERLARPPKTDTRDMALARFTDVAQRAFAQRFSLASTVQQAIRDAIETGDRLCFFCTADGRVQMLPGARAPAPHAESANLYLQRGHLRHRHFPSHRRMAHLLQSACSGQAGAAFLPDGPGQVLYVQARPAPQASNVATGALALVTIRVRHSVAAPAAPALAQTFGLTPGEADVLLSLCQGKTVSECAADSSRSVATIRSHVASLLRKMGCRRQTDLVRCALGLLP